MGFFYPDHSNRSGQEIFLEGGEMRKGHRRIRNPIALEGSGAAVEPKAKAVAPAPAKGGRYLTN